MCSILRHRHSGKSEEETIGNGELITVFRVRDSTYYVARDCKRKGIHIPDDCPTLFQQVTSVCMSPVHVSVSLFNRDCCLSGACQGRQQPFVMEGRCGSQSAITAFATCCNHAGFFDMSTSTTKSHCTIVQPAVVAMVTDAAAPITLGDMLLLTSYVNTSSPTVFDRLQAGAAHGTGGPRCGALLFVACDPFSPH